MSNAIKHIPITSDTMVDKPFDMKLGTSMMQFPEGTALCTDAVSLTIIQAERPDTHERFIVVIGVADFEGHHLGSLSPMTPNSARRFAASLVKAANECDAQRGLA